MHISINSDFDSDGTFIFAGHHSDDNPISDATMSKEDCEALYNMVKSFELPTLDCCTMSFHWNGGKTYDNYSSEYMITNPKHIALILI